MAVVTNAVEELLETEVLNEGQATALLATLEAAAKQLVNGNSTAAANLLQAFINQVQALVNAGILTPQEGQALIDLAQNAIDQLNA